MHHHQSWKTINIQYIHVLRRQCWNTNRNSKYKKVGVLPIWIVKSNVSSVAPSTDLCSKR